MTAAPRVVLKQDGSDGASRKYLWRTADGLSFESGAYTHGHYDSVCVSSQLGCNVGCTFCVTGLETVVRNLTLTEIVTQVERTAPRPSDRPLKVSFQGMGEPLLNYGAVTAAVNALWRSGFVHMIGISTVGFPRLLERLAGDQPGLKLQISLHAASDGVRHVLVPAARGTRISDTLDAACAYADCGGEALVLNYLLLRGVNDAETDARALARAVRPAVERGARVKLSRFNPSSSLPHSPSTEQAAGAFASVLRDEGVPYYTFASLGTDIASGCGQLRRGADDE